MLPAYINKPCRQQYVTATSILLSLYVPQISNRYGFIMWRELEGATRSGTTYHTG